MSEKDNKSDKIEKWIYHTEGTNVCSDCAVNEGKQFKSLEEAPKLPVHPNCRCWLEPIELEMCPVCLAIDGYVADFESTINEMQVFAANATNEIAYTIAMVEEKAKYA